MNKTAIFYDGNHKNNFLLLKALKNIYLIFKKRVIRKLKSKQGYQSSLYLNLLIL